MSLLQIYVQIHVLDVWKSLYLSKNQVFCVKGFGLMIKSKNHRLMATKFLF